MELTELPGTPQEARALGLKWYFTGKPCKNGHLDMRLVLTSHCRTCSADRQKSEKGRAQSRARHHKRYGSDPVYTDRQKMNASHYDKRRRAVDPEWARRKSESATVWKLSNPDAARLLRERENATNRERRRTDPNYRAHHNAAKKKSWRGKMGTPDGREQVNAYRREYSRRRYHEDIQFRETKRMRGRIRATLRRRAFSPMSYGEALTLVEVLWGQQLGCCATPGCDAVLCDGFHFDHIHPVSRGGDNDPDNIQLLCPRCNLSKRDLPMIVFMAQRAQTIHEARMMP